MSRKTKEVEKTFKEKAKDFFFFVALLSSLGFLIGITHTLGMWVAIHVIGITSM